MAHILIVDDDTQVRDMLRQMLEREGHQVSEAADGGKAIKCYREFPADLVITDILMPEKDGLETILGLKREFSDVKIIALSGGGQVAPKNYLLMAQKLGAQRILTKPVERKEMLGAVRELLGDKG
ncbi:MAG: response regulator [Deltaproteobacteria bacterium]|nr:response regulator [Deltaproteobacteria bacterium]